MVQYQFNITAAKELIKGDLFYVESEYEVLPQLLSTSRSAEALRLTKLKIPKVRVDSTLSLGEDW